MLLRTILAHFSTLVVVPVAVVATRLVLQKASGNLERWGDEKGRLMSVFSWRAGGRSWEFLVGVVRSFAAIALARASFALLQVRPTWALALLLVALLCAIDVWQLQFTKRSWPKAAAHGIKSWKVDEATAAKVLVDSQEASGRMQATIRALLFGDVVGAVLGGAALIPL